MQTVLKVHGNSCINFLKSQTYKCLPLIIFIFKSQKEDRNYARGIVSKMSHIVPNYFGNI